jgi:hypothetical protein
VVHGGVLANVNDLNNLLPGKDVQEQRQRLVTIKNAQE